MRHLLDFTVLSWIYGFIHPDIFNLIVKNDASAYQVWQTIENLFSDNKKVRTIQLESEFYGLHQGSLSIEEYCMQMKALANGLANVSNSMSVKNLVLQTIGGLNESFSNIKSLIQFAKPLPSFQETHNSLILEETCHANMISLPSALITIVSVIQRLQLHSLEVPLPRGEIEPNSA